MKQLIEIRTNPIEIDMSYQKAQLEVVNNQKPSYNMTRDRGGLEMSYKPGRMQMDSYELRSALGFKNNNDFLKEYSQKGASNVMDVMQRRADEADLMRDSGMNGKPDNFMAQIAASRMASDVNYNVAYMPLPAINFQWEPHQLDMQYQVDKLNFDWNVNMRVQYQYTPASLEFNVTQYPSVDIEYVGEPLYVPPRDMPEYA